jgi:hypothetical protein
MNSAIRLLTSRREWLVGLMGSACSGAVGSAAQPRYHTGQYSHVVNASTHQRVHRPFRLTCALLRPGLKQRYRGRISFHSTDPTALLPSPYTFRETDDSLESHSFEVRLNKEGHHRVWVREEESGREFSSNMILASRKDPDCKLYFGDIHIHSNWSPDGRGEPAYNYLYARDAMNLDFACLTEHDPKDDTWEQLKVMTRRFDEPNRFATLLAYEWTAHKLGAGHKNVYYRDLEGPVLRANWRTDRTSQTTSAADLWAQLGACGHQVMTIPHHPAAAWFPTPWEQRDPRFQRCVEVYSSWGSSEYAGSPRQIPAAFKGPRPGCFVQDGLATGQRLGFVAGSDSHSGRPGFTSAEREFHDSDYSDWGPAGYTGGFTAVYAEALTREAIFDAIQSRRCYATTGQRIIVDFRADAHWMGTEYHTREAPHLNVRVIGTGPIESVTIVKNNRDYVRKDVDGWECEFSHDRTDRPRDTDFYYVRVIQRDGEMAWSSPIWVTRKV